MKKMLVFMMIVAMLMSSFTLAFTKVDVTPVTPSGSVQTKAVNVIGIIQWAGYIVAIGMLVWVGIKYVMSGAAEKAKAKETLIPIVIGAILIAGAAWIAEFIFTMV